MRQRAGGMATTTAFAGPRAINRDRLFYSGLCIIIAIFVLVGFAQSWFLSHWFAPPPGTPKIGMLLAIHGTVFTSWVVLLVAQPLLVARREISLHRTLGYFGAALAIAMYVVGNIAAIAAMHGGFIGLGDPYAFYAIPFADIQVFGLFVALAVIRRNRPEEHKRLMLLAATQILEPALARFPSDAAAAAFPYFSTFGCDAVIVAGIAYDWWARRRVHPVWLWGGAIVLASEVIRLLIRFTGPWLAFAHFAARLYIPG
jgi:hypothetical protein